MSVSAQFREYNLEFRFAAGTSRGVLHHKKVYYLILQKGDAAGYGECSVIPGLSLDDVPEYADKIKEICRYINQGGDTSTLDLSAFPSIAFGLETALLDLKAKGSKLLFDGEFTAGIKGIPINGLVWMGNRDFMEEQIKQKIEAGFHCIKIKIGAIDFQTELDIIARIRKKYHAADLELRLDANGAFSPGEAPGKLKQLSEYNIHSVEQPIRAGNPDEMARICRLSPVPVALDEELIGIFAPEQKVNLLETIRPAYIILKPGLLGGLERTQEWINLARKYNTGWWITSALESNIGLNAIAQFTASLDTSMPQGLGTGQLYTNNLPSPLETRGEQLFYNRSKQWDLAAIQP